MKYAEKSSVVVDSDTLTSMLEGCRAVETRALSTQIHQRSPLDLVRTPRMRKRTVILCYNWYADYFCRIMQLESFHWLSSHEVQSHYTKLFKYGKRTLDSFGAFLIKRLFHSLLLDMKWQIANSACGNLMSNALVE